MNIEDQLARELGAVADAEAAPHVDVAGVRRVAGRERRLRRGVAAGAVAAAVALVALVATVVPRVGTDRVDPATPVGPAPLALAWSEGDTVHLPSGRTIQVDALEAVTSRGGTTLVHTGGSDPQWSRVDDTGDEPALVGLTGSTTGSPVLSLDGSHVAWIEPLERGAGYRLSSLDLADGQRTDFAPLDGGEGAESVLGVTGVDDRGWVLVERRDAPQLLWPPGSGVEPIGADLPGGSGVVLLARGLAAVYDRDILRGELWSLPSADSFTRIGDLDPVTALSFDDDASAYVTDETRPAVVRIGDDGAQHRVGELGLPEGSWSVAGWESAVSVVLRGGDGSLKRCSTTGLTCQGVPSIGGGVVAS